MMFNPLNKKYYATPEQVDYICQELFPVKVEQVRNKNQYAITCNQLKVFQSYQTIIFISYNGNYFLNSNFLLDKFTGTHTTSKHLYIYLNEWLNLQVDNKKEIVEMLKKGTIKLINL